MIKFPLSTTKSSSIIFKCREYFSRALIFSALGCSRIRKCAKLCHYWFTVLEAALHQCPWAATATRLSLSSGILLTEENYSLACMLHAKQTIFSHLHLSPHFAIKAWLGEQSEEGQRSGECFSYSLKKAKREHAGGDTGYHRQWQRNVQAVPIAVTGALSCPARYQREVDSQWWC